MIYKFGDLEPKINPSVFIAPDASVIGDVEIGSESNVWFGSTIRGDVHSIRIGKYTSIQDHSMLHVTGGKFSLTIGDYCTLGHRVTLHGCHLDNHAFIGIGATVLDGCHIGEYSLVAAGALVTPGKIVPPRMVVMGSPAKVVREITPAEEDMIRNIPLKYAKLKNDYLNTKVFKLIP